jgi:hypothetical protein
VSSSVSSNELALAHAGYGRLYQQPGLLEQARKHQARAPEIVERPRTRSDATGRL